MSANQLPLQTIPGFEATDYRLLHGRVVWVGGSQANAEPVEHPRNLHAPWLPPAPTQALDGLRVRKAAADLLKNWANAGDEQMQLPAPRGLLLWLLGQPLPFPLQAAASRFDAIAEALRAPAHADTAPLVQACVRVLGLGPGLTPSGDDFVGGLVFTLHHLGCGLAAERWNSLASGIRHALRAAQAPLTNPISAALLDDWLAGRSHRAAHALLDTLASPADPSNAIKTVAACGHLLRIGSTSGFDILAGMLAALTFTTHHEPQ